MIREGFQEGKIYGKCSIRELDVHFTGVHFTTLLHNLMDVTCIVLCFKYQMTNVNTSTVNKTSKK